MVPSAFRRRITQKKRLQRPRTLPPFSRPRSTFRGLEKTVGAIRKLAADESTCLFNGSVVPIHSGFALGHQRVRGVPFGIGVTIFKVLPPAVKLGEKTKKLSLHFGRSESWIGS